MLYNNTQEYNTILYNIVTSLVRLYWAVCVSPVLSTSHVLGSFNPPVSPMRFYFYPQFAGEETNTSQSYNQTVGGGAGTQAAGCTALPSCHSQKFRTSNLAPWSLCLWLGPSSGCTQGRQLLTTVRGLKSFLWNLPWPAVCTYFHFQHAISTFSLQSPHPLLCQDRMTAPRHSALSFKRSPLFLTSGQGVHIPLPTGVLSLPISGSVLLLKPTEWKCLKTTAMTLLAFTSTSTRHSFPTLFGLVGPLEPSSALEVNFCFYLFYILGFHVKFHLKTGPIFKNVWKSLKSPNIFAITKEILSHLSVPSRPKSL